MICLSLMPLCILLKLDMLKWIWILRATDTWFCQTKCKTAQGDPETMQRARSCESTFAATSCQRSLDVFQIPECSIPIHGPAWSKGTCPQRWNTWKFKAIFPNVSWSNLELRLPVQQLNPSAKTFWKLTPKVDLLHRPGHTSRLLRPCTVQLLVTTTCKWEQQSHLLCSTMFKRLLCIVIHIDVSLHWRHFHIVTLGCRFRYKAIRSTS